MCELKGKKAESGFKGAREKLSSRFEPLRKRSAEEAVNVTFASVVIDFTSCDARQMEMLSKALRYVVNSLNI